MVRTNGGDKKMLAPRKDGLTFNTMVANLVTIGVDETINLDELHITGIKGTHGPMTLKFGPFKKTLHEGPNERFGYGEMGFQITFQGKTVMNLGDTLIHPKEWASIIKAPDVLMIPIGGKIPGNTMDEADALKAVQIIRPKLVIPVHYNCGAMFSRCYNPADEIQFKKEVEKQGMKCNILQTGESIIV
jgi:L-ascorbate metabolism protein UlaG (beta-lactamase superfamily)